MISKSCIVFCRTAWLDMMSAVHLLENAFGPASLPEFFVCQACPQKTKYACGACFCVGKTRARDAALNAIQSPLLDIGIERATGIVWNITGGSDLTLYEVSLSLS